LLLGRQTFEDFRRYWPEQTDDHTGITDYLNQVEKYVVSSTIDDPGWANATVLRLLGETIGSREHPTRVCEPTRMGIRKPC
jgi:dihydrofolate reductase